MQIKALDTDLWGYKFRSRLEARWAVFFDRMGIEWQYETQGFMLPSGPYLPDFFLPKWGLWFEVNGKAADDEERQRCKDLSHLWNGCLLAEGPVGERALTIFGFRARAGWSPEPFEGDAWITSGSGDPEIVVYEDDCEIFYFNSQWGHCSGFYTSDQVGAGWRDDHAITAARSARFEHGQAPRRLHGC